tara:strand:+ start:2912 stop:3193 length:282 start_codon:yes stop_codon:yes gene_type:complete
MVRELTAKHLAAINRGRKAKGMKPIRRKNGINKLTIAEKNERSFISGVDWITIEKRLSKILKNPKLNDAQKKKAFNKEYNKHAIFKKTKQRPT